MAVQTPIESVQVVFVLPDWTSNEQFDEEVIIRYCGGHAWEGQVKGYRNDNVISSGLFSLGVRGVNAEVTETCLDPMSQSVTVTFACGLRNLPTQVRLFKNRLQQFLCGYLDHLISIGRPNSVLD